MANNDWGFGSDNSSFSNDSFGFEAAPASKGNKKGSTASSNEWSMLTTPQPVQAEKGVNLNSGFQPESRKREKIKGPWYWPLTLLCLFVVAALSFGMVYLTKDVFPQRNVWLIGLHFLVPLAAMLFSTLYLEHRTGAMTPNGSRKKQLFIILAAVAMTFTVGCVSDLLYIQGHVKKLPKQEQKITTVQSNNIVFLLDKSTSLTTSQDAESQKAILSIIDTMPDDACVGIVLFHHEIYESLPIFPLTPAFRSQIKTVLSRPLSGGTNFELPLRAAWQMFDQNPPNNNYSNSIIMITDGTEPLSNADHVLATATRYGIPISTISVSNTYIRDDLKQVVTSTGGTFCTTSSYDELASQIEEVAQVTVEEIVVVVPEDRDLLRSTHPTAVTISGIMLLLEGIVLGLCMWLMFSVHGQFRTQAILSPLMAVAAFVLVKLGPFLNWYSYHWLIEGAAFTLFGIVFMRKNRNLKEEPQNDKPGNPQQNQQPQQSQSAPTSDFNFF